ncbi:Lysozyme RrrD [Halomonadaceae bacterium LMG 33818]|uniref:lysozyme n=1 Tax=Cernens ardua TaxID=3402176 RepID=UPI003EDC1BBF
MRIPGSLRQKIVAAGSGGAIAVAAILAMHSEGVSYRPYFDPTGTLTVCYGHTGSDIDPNRTYTQSECQAFLNHDLDIADRVVRRYATVPMNAYQQGSMDDFVFNIGAGNFRRSTVLRKLNSGDYVGSCFSFNAWVYSKGIKLKGLMTRRQLEDAVCSIGNEQ